jgi:hypothetical protein
VDERQEVEHAGRISGEAELLDTIEQRELCRADRSRNGLSLGEPRSRLVDLRAQCGAPPRQAGEEMAFPLR